MPANLPPEYFEVEARFRAAKSPEEKISTLEELISTIPKHKGTEKLRADLRRRLSKLRSDSQKQSKASRHESQFHIEREGAVRVVVIGPPNTGKSSLVKALTHARPKVSENPHTTWMPTPGMMPLENIQVQIIDTPPMSPEHTDPELIGLIKGSDLALIILDLQADPMQQLEDTLTVLRQHRIVPKDDDNEDGETRMDSIACIVVLNKDDDESLDEDFRIAQTLIGEQSLTIIPISALTGRNLGQMKQVVFEELEIIRVFSKPPGKDADLGAPFVLKKGSTVADFAEKIHKDFAEFKSARIWGKGVYDGQLVGRTHVVNDGDIVELHL